jgi:hypothetical protein
VTPEHRAAARKRLADATPGPWAVRERTAWCVDASGPDGRGAEWHPASVRDMACDADFIAHAPTDLAAALDALDVLEGEIARLRAGLQEIFEADPEGPDFSGLHWEKSDGTEVDAPYEQARRLLGWSGSRPSEDPDGS